MTALCGAQSAAGIAAAGWRDDLVAGALSLHWMLLASGTACPVLHAVDWHCVHLWPASIITAAYLVYAGKVGSGRLRALLWLSAATPVAVILAHLALEGAPSPRLDAILLAGILAVAIRALAQRTEGIRA